MGRLKFDEGHFVDELNLILGPTNTPSHISFLGRGNYMEAYRNP
jgi:hypothetical protein